MLTEQEKLAAKSSRAISFIDGAQSARVVAYGKKGVGL